MCCVEVCAGVGSLPRTALSLTLHPSPLNKTYNSKLHYLLGYFALVGLNRLECLLGDFQVSSLVRTFVCWVCISLAYMHVP